MQNMTNVVVGRVIEQRTRAIKLDSAVKELLSLDTLNLSREEHIDYASELVSNYAQTWGLAVEVAGSDLDPTTLNESLRWIAEAHLRIAELRVR